MDRSEEFLKYLQFETKDRPGIPDWERPSTSSNPPRSPPADDTTSEANSSLETSGSTETSTTDADNCDETIESETLADATAVSETETESEPVVSNPNHSPVSVNESSNSGNTVVFMNNEEFAGNLNVVEEVSKTVEALNDTEVEQAVDDVAADDEVEIPSKVTDPDTEVTTEVAAEVEADVEADVEMETELTETPASPTDDGDEVIDLLPYKRMRYLPPEETMYVQQEMRQPAPPVPSMVARDPRQQRLSAPSKGIRNLLNEDIESISGSSQENSSSGESEDDDGDEDVEEFDDDDERDDDDDDATSRDTVTAPETIDMEGETGGVGRSGVGDLALQKIEIIENPKKIYYIRRDDGTVHAGQVLQSRCTDNSSTPNEYYVHYVGLNRRLDAWVGRHRISTNAEDLGGVSTPTPPTPANSEQPGTSSSSTSGGGVGTGNGSGCGSGSGPGVAAVVGGNSSSQASVSRPRRQVNKDYYLSACDNSRYDHSDKKMTRYQKRRYDEINHVQKSHAELTAAQAALEKEHENITKIKYIDKLQFGNYEIDTWYFSPFPDEYREARVLYVCEYCLKYMMREKSYRYHMSECKRRQPPGEEIYRKGTISIYEVNGKKEPLYCQLLCLMAKMFLDHKGLFFDMDPFFFYVLCEIDKEGSHIVGYFSKEKRSYNNVACILVLPPHQRKGYGKLLIAFSYVLSRKEGIIGSPEIPLSDLGRLSYRSYWAYTLLELMKGRSSAEQTSIEELSNESGITRDDIIYTLQSMKMIKYWKGQNVICVTAKTIHEHLQLPQFKRPKLTIDLNLLYWKPHKPHITHHTIVPAPTVPGSPATLRTLAALGAHAALGGHGASAGTSAALGAPSTQAMNALEAPEDLGTTTAPVSQTDSSLEDAEDAETGEDLESSASLEASTASEASATLSKAY